MTHETLAVSTQIWGTIFFVVMFAGVLVYALWPGNRAKFDKAAKAPFADDTLED